MKIGIVGFSGSGKSTVFTWLTAVKPDPALMQRGQVGIAKIADARLDWLSAHFHPKKTTHATIELVDTPGLLTSERKDNPRRLAILREADGLLIVLTGFGGGDAAQELRNFRAELAFADLEIVTNRISKLEAQGKKPKPAKEREADEQELALLKRIAAALEERQSTVEVGLSEEQEKAVRSFQMLTLKPELVLLNIGDDRIGKPLPDSLVNLSSNAQQAPVKLEMELAELPESDRGAFMQDLGLAGFSLDTILHWLFYGMGRIAFFTVGEDECRAWPIHRGDNAQTGAGQIHTDLAEGFVRAEIVPFEDFKKLGSMKEAKAHGVYRLEGKIYIVKDGDIMHILANK
jgi:ribosome-binding ATPase YchF (GTP1/OBG family)